MKKPIIAFLVLGVLCAAGAYVFIQREDVSSVQVEEQDNGPLVEAEMAAESTSIEKSLVTSATETDGRNCDANGSMSSPNNVHTFRFWTCHITKEEVAAIMTRCGKAGATECYYDDFYWEISLENESKKELFRFNHETATKNQKELLATGYSWKRFNSVDSSYAGHLDVVFVDDSNVLFHSRVEDSFVIKKFNLPSQIISPVFTYDESVSFDDRYEFNVSTYLEDILVFSLQNVNKDHSLPKVQINRKSGETMLIPRS